MRRSFRKDKNLFPSTRPARAKDTNREYINLLKQVKNSGDLHKMKFLLESYIEKGGKYPSYSTTRNNTLGDCSGDGLINISDLIFGINYVLDIEGFSDGVIGDTVEANCDVSYDLDNKQLIAEDDGISVIDLIAIINFILAPEYIPGCTNPEADNYCEECNVDDGSCIYTLPVPEDIITDDEVIAKSYGYQYGDPENLETYPMGESYNSTNTFSLGKNGESIEDGYEIFNSLNTEPEYGPNVVLITAPHGQRHFRPTRWVGTGNHDNPSAGSHYCNGSYDDHDPTCHKDADTCTSAMAKALSDFTGASAIVTRYVQEDPNYYHRIGVDRWCCDDSLGDSGDASNNLWSTNEIDPTEAGYGYFGEGTLGGAGAGIQTPAYYDAYWGDGGPNNTWDGINQKHPFKQAVDDYILDHPEIKLVIDFHGASYTSNPWDVDFGLTCTGAGPWDNLEFAQICGDPPIIDKDMLGIMAETFYEYGIGRCEAVMGNDGKWLKYGNCPDGYTGHGHISYNDWTGGGQDTVTQWVNDVHGPSGVQVVQLEVSAIYRCNNSDEAEVLKFMRAMQAIIIRANMYYNSLETNIEFNENIKRNNENKEIKNPNYKRKNKLLGSKRQKNIMKRDNYKNRE
tara:strand:+ start:276 stop:2147 length:1872 start_codon:yes stop_codon:yes gene_type:complete